MIGCMPGVPGHGGRPVKGVPAFKIFCSKSCVPNEVAMQSYEGRLGRASLIEGCNVGFMMGSWMSLLQESVWHS